MPQNISRLTTGFPSPTEDHDEATLDLTDFLIKHPAATFFMLADSDALQASGIRRGDVLVVDRSLTPSAEMIVIAVYQGDFYVRRYHPTSDGYLLLADETLASMRVSGLVECEIWGVVTHSIHQHTIADVPRCQ